MVYRVALEHNLRFQPAAAGPIYLNAAYVYHYYGETDTAFGLIAEVEAMQNPEDHFGKDVLRQCAEVRTDLIALSSRLYIRQNGRNLLAAVQYDCFL